MCIRDRLVIKISTGHLIICGSYKTTLEGWLRGTRKAMPLVIPRIWLEPTNHYDDCHFCMVNITKYGKVKEGNLFHTQIFPHPEPQFLIMKITLYLHHPFC